MVTFAITALVRLPILFLIPMSIAETVFVALVTAFIGRLVLHSEGAMMIEIPASVVQSSLVARFPRPFLSFFPAPVIMSLEERFNQRLRARC